MVPYLLYCIVWRGLGFDFGIWVGIPLFWTVVSVRDMDEGDGGWIGFIFGPGGIRGKEWEGWVILLLSGLSWLERAGNWFWSLGRDSPVLVRGSHGGSLRG